MAGYFTVTIGSLPQPLVANVDPEREKRNLTVGITVTPIDDFKGSMTLNYSCEANDANDDPILDKESDQVFLDAVNPVTKPVVVTGLLNQPITFTAEGSALGGEYDIDSKSGVIQ